MPQVGAGQRCSANAACESGVCGVDGTGLCCTSSCFPALGECGATGCDYMGACIWVPDYIYCGGNDGARCTGTGYCGY